MVNQIYPIDKNIKLSSFKSSENIQKKEGGPDSTVSNNQFSSVTLNELANNARRNCNLIKLILQIPRPPFGFLTAWFHPKCMISVMTLIFI